VRVRELGDVEVLTGRLSSAVLRPGEVFTFGLDQGERRVFGVVPTG